MKTIGIISDTHGTVVPRVLSFLEKCDYIWHAGDIGNLSTLQQIENKTNTIAVFGNIDDYQVRRACKEIAIYTCEKVKVVMMHIGGYPQHYTKLAKEVILREQPNIFISGHSHILRIIYDKQLKLLHINPGAAGNHGFHTHITAIKLIIDEDNIRDLEILELPRKPH